MADQIMLWGLTQLMTVLIVGEWTVSKKERVMSEKEMYGHLLSIRHCKHIIRIKADYNFLSYYISVAFLHSKRQLAKRKGFRKSLQFLFIFLYRLQPSFWSFVDKQLSFYLASIFCWLSPAGGLDQTFSFLSNTILLFFH